MKIIINTDILRKHNLSLAEFLVLLTSYYEIEYTDTFNSLLSKELINKNLFKDYSPVINDSTKKLVTSILIESDDRVANSTLDFESLAEKLQNLYPDGIKAGKTYSWRGETREIVYRLMMLVARLDFKFTEQEAIDATKEYINSFEPPYQCMHTLQNFILYNSKSKGIESIFMSIIENNREKNA